MASDLRPIASDVATLRPGDQAKPTRFSTQGEDRYSRNLSFNLLGQTQWGHTKALVTFVGLSLLMFMVCAAETMFNQILDELKRDLQTGIFAQWMAVAFLLPCVMVQPIWVKLAEKFGRPWPLLISTLVFMVFSLVVAVSRSMMMLCVGRALQGVGGAGMMPLALVVLTDILTPRQRAAYMGVLGAVIILATWASPVIGAVLFANGNWRWVGYMNLPIGAVAVAILYFTLHDLPTPPGRTARKLREFDYLGTMFWLGGSTMILLALSWGGNEYRWDSALVICLFVFGFATIIVFGIIEGKYAKWPIIPLHLLTRRRTLLTIVVSFLIGLCMYGMVIFVPMYYLMVVVQKPLPAATHVLWFALGGGVGSVVAGALVSVRSRVYYREWAVLGTALMAVGYVLMYTWPRDPAETAKHAGFQVVVGLGLGFCMQQVLLASQAGVPANEISTVTTLIDYARTLGGMIGLVIGEVILKERISATVRESFGAFMPAGGGAGQDTAAVGSFAPLISILPVSMSEPLFRGIVRALHLVFVVDVPFAVLACVLCLFIGNIPLHHILPVTSTEEIAEGVVDVYNSAENKSESRVNLIK
ncbi:hypothetical protein GGI20_004398 [Coemansia sp. BCRC 34301]|nr:hypothetical protein GGI20_004398 [Coemansia sp. BCRC 34301]